ncbi:MAG: hypothetical protein ABI873_11090 [Marmoricola sp.]
MIEEVSSAPPSSVILTADMASPEVIDVTVPGSWFAGRELHDLPFSESVEEAAAWSLHDAPHLVRGCAQAGRVGLRGCGPMPLFILSR